MRCVFPRRKRGEVEKSVPSLLQLIESFPSFLSPAAASFHSLPSLLFIYLFIYFFWGGAEVSSLSTLSVLSLYLFNVFRERKEKEKKNTYKRYIYDTRVLWTSAHCNTFHSRFDSTQRRATTKKKKETNKTHFTNFRSSMLSFPPSFLFFFFPFSFFSRRCTSWIYLKTTYLSYRQSLGS